MVRLARPDRLRDANRGAAAKELRMNTKSTLALGLIATAFAATALAQQPSTTESATISSEPGSAKAVRTVELSAKVVAIDKATRTVTLKGRQGTPVDVVAGDGVRNFDQIKLGDMVVTRYTEALALELRKTKAAGGDVTVSEGSTWAKPGDKPAAAGERQVTAIAEVVAVDPKKSTITLKGPRGNIVTLAVHNPDQFKVVKKGDQVDVTYTEALALSVEPAPKSAPEKKG
jgi:hypothetical protein